MATKKKKKPDVFLDGYIHANNPIPSNPVISPQTNYSQSYLEWALKNRPSIFKDAIVTSGTSTIYTVPQGYVLYITSAYLTSINRSAVATQPISISIPAGDILQMLISLAPAAPPFPFQTVTAAFPFPIRIPAGTVITLTGNATVDSLTTGGIIGFLEFLEA